MGDNRRCWGIVDSIPKSEREDWLFFVHPYKQKSVLELVKSARKNEHVKRLILFGSSVSTRCRPDSDVDLFFVGNRSKFTPPLIDVFDIITGAGLTKSSPIVQEIVKDGIVIYEQ